MKILLIADTHGSLNKHDIDKLMAISKEKIDIVICMGDIYFNELKIIKDVFCNFPVYGIPGNHEPQKYIEQAGIINFHGQAFVFKNVTFVGMGGSVKYKKNDDLLLLSDKESKRIAKDLPSSDIFITHSPFYIPHYDKVHQGLKGIEWYIKHRNPKYHFFGHIHQRMIKNHQKTISYGIYKVAMFDSETNTLFHYI